MGGGYYERDDNNSSNYSNNDNVDQQFSQTANFLIKANDLDPSLSPKLYEINKLKSTGQTPIVFAVDVTGSMGDWVKIIYDKFPMFYGQMNLQCYAKDPSVSFCAIGDEECSKVPLQISQFSTGIAIDSVITKIFLEGGGGGNLRESYELAAYFYLNKCELVNYEYPFFFITGDEAFFNEVSIKNAFKVLGDKIPSNINSREIFKNLKDKFNIFHLRKKFEDENKEKGMYKQWSDTIGTERVLEVNSPKACIDVILGAIAITTGARTLEEYVTDMITRGQTNERIKEVTQALILYNTKLNNGDCWPVRNEKFVDNTYNSSNLSNLQGNNQEINNQTNYSAINLIVQTYKSSDNVYSNDKIELRERLRKIYKDVGDSVPQDFICPLTQEIFVDPVMTSDGTTFENYVITKILARLGNICPIKGTGLESSNLLPNVVMRKIINDFSQKI